MKLQRATAESLRVRVEALPSNTPDLLSLVPAGASFQCWLGPDAKVVGWGEALRLEFAGSSPLREASRRWDEIAGAAVVEYVGGAHQDLGVSAPLAFASFGFSPATPGLLIVPAAAVVRRGNQAIAVTAGAGEAPSFAADLLAEAGGDASETAPAGLRTLPGRMTQKQWVAAVGRLTDLLREGAASKVVLARDILVSSPLPIDERFLVRRLRQLYPTTWVYAVGGLVGATPEMLAAKFGADVTSRILAGTSAPGRGQDLLTSEKDLAEHHFAVESVSGALQPIAEWLDAPARPALLELPNVTHLSTEVKARVPGANLLDIVEALHPTAAVCGTPRQLAFEILEEFEGPNRGRYSGPVGWIDGAGGGEFGIALRCGQLSEDRREMRVFAGAGIMPDSVPDAELAETRAKMKPVLQALAVAEQNS